MQHAYGLLAAAAALVPSAASTINVVHFPGLRECKRPDHYAVHRSASRDCAAGKHTAA